MGEVSSSNIFQLLKPLLSTRGDKPQGSTHSAWGEISDLVTGASQGIYENGCVRALWQYFTERGKVNQEEAIRAFEGNIQVRSHWAWWNEADFAMLTWSANIRGGILSKQSETSPVTYLFFSPQQEDRANFREALGRTQSRRKQGAKDAAQGSGLRGLFDPGFFGVAMLQTCRDISRTTELVAKSKAQCVVIFDVPGGHFLPVVRGKERGYNEGPDETKGGGEDGKSEKQRTIAGDQAAHVPPRTHRNPREGGTLTGMAAASTGGTGRRNKDEGKHTGGDSGGGGDRSGSGGDEGRTAPREPSERAEGSRKVDNRPAWITQREYVATATIAAAMATSVSTSSGSGGERGGDSGSRTGSERGSGHPGRQVGRSRPAEWNPRRDGDGWGRGRREGKFMEAARGLGLGAAAATMPAAAATAGTELASQAIAPGEDRGAVPPPRKVDEVTGWGDEWDEDEEGPNKRLLGSPGEDKMGRPDPKQQSRGILQYAHRKGRNGGSRAVHT